MSKLVVPSSTTAMRHRVSFTEGSTTHEVLTVDSMFAGAKETVGIYLMASVATSGNATGIAIVETANSHAVPLVEKAIAEEYRTTFDAVKWVVVTHAHLDHCAGAGQLMARCPNATLLCHPRAKRHLIDPTALLASAAKVYSKEQLQVQVGDMIPVDANRVRAVEDGEAIELMPGRNVAFYHVLGHAKHHFILHDVATSSVISGDAFGSSAWTIGEPNIFYPATAPIDFDYAEAIKSIDKILSLQPKHVWPTHYASCEQPTKAAEQLKQQLAEYEAMRCKVSFLGQKGVDPQLLMPELMKGTRRSLESTFKKEGGTLSWHGFISGSMKINAQGLAVAAQRFPVDLDDLPEPLLDFSRRGIRPDDGPLDVATVLAMEEKTQPLASMVLQEGLSGKQFTDRMGAKL